MKKLAPYLLLVVVFFSGCALNNRYKVPQYRDLLMYSQMPKEVFGHWNNGSFMQFQRFEKTDGGDTIVVVKFDSDGRFEFVNGIGIGDEFVRHKFMDILSVNGDAFFTYNYSNTGNSNNNIVGMLYIAPDCSLHRVEVERADSLYSITLPDNQFIWDGEEINFTQYPITSQFYIWNKTDTHPQPTVGKVSVVYRMRKIGETEYRLYPAEIKFTEGAFDTQDNR